MHVPESQVLYLVCTLCGDLNEECFPQVQAFEDLALHRWIPIGDACKGLEAGPPGGSYVTGSRL